jgi:hypothetical protein
VDLLELATFLLALGCFGLLLAGILTVRRAIPRLPLQIGAAARSAVMSYAFVDSEETDDKGATRTVRRPSPAFIALVDQIAPILVVKALQAGKSMLSKGGLAAVGRADGEGIDMSKMLEFLPKQYRGIAAIVGPKLLGNLLGGGSPKASSDTATNPFLAGAK